MTPAAIIRQARLSAGLTQQALASAVGVSVGTVARWEAGTREPSWGHLHSAVWACGCVARLGLYRDGEEVGP